MGDTLLQDYDTLGEIGGGTLELEAGVYQFNDAIEFRSYSNISIQGAGMGKTFISLPPSPIGKFRNSSGSLVSTFNLSTGQANPPGVTANFLTVGPELDNFEMCNLSVDARATNASEDWAGSLIMDSGGGVHHVYSDIAEVGLDGQSGTPNGLHIDGYSHPALDYVIDDFFAVNDSWPAGSHHFYAGGPNFLNTGDVTNCTEENVTGIGDLEYEVAPSPGCVVENVNVTGHILIDPAYENSNTDGWNLPLGSWGGALFENVTANVSNTGGPNAMQISNGSSDFNNLRWVDDHFVGSVINGNNMVVATNSTFDGGMDALPAVFEGNSVAWVPSLWGRIGLQLPISPSGLPPGGPLPGNSSVLDGNTFIFPNGTGRLDPFQLAVSQNTWSNDTIEVSGATRGFVTSAPGILLSQNSSFTGVTYDSLGNGSPPDLVFFDIVGSPGFQDLGATIGVLTGVYNDLPLYVPSAPLGLSGSAQNPLGVALSWDVSSGPVTNYTVLVGETPTTLATEYSAGPHTSYVVEGLLPGSVNYFGVEAWNFSYRSSISAPIEVTTPPLSEYAPSLPAGLAVASVGITDATLQWNASSGTVTNYTILVGLSPLSLAQWFSVGGLTRIGVAGLEPNTTYYFALEAWNETWTLGQTAPVNATTLQVDYPPPIVHLSTPDPLIGLAVIAGVVGGVFGAVVIPLMLVGRARARAVNRRRARRAG
ncbi:MAG: fibronectin type III domain-containing protein [Thermoplasmata archaeon]